MQHEHTEHVAAAPDAVFRAIADVDNLPRFVPQMTQVESAGDGQVAVDARYDGRDQHGEARFERDESQRRIAWSADSGYHGWMQVDPDGDGSRLTLFLETKHDGEREADISSTLDAIRMLVEAEV